MGRLLDEDAVIKVLECWQKAFRENSHYVSASDLSLVVKDVRELPPAQPEPTNKVSFGDKDHVWIDGKQYISLLRFQEKVKEVQPKEGHWIWVAGDLECSKCHTRYPDLYPDYDNSVACPHCGAKMTISTK